MTASKRLRAALLYISGIAAAAICALTVHPLFWLAAVPFAIKAVSVLVRSASREGRRPSS